MAFRWEVGGSPPNPFPLDRGAPSSHTVTSDRAVRQGFSAPRTLREVPEALLLVPLLFLLLLGSVPDKAQAQDPRFGDTTWVAQSNGVHPYRIGQSHEFYLDVGHGLYFAPDGRRVA